MEQLNQKLQEQFDKMCATGMLFRVNISGHDLWDIYLSAFKDDPVFRDPESSVHNCQQCNSFIKRYGNIVAIDENLKMMSMFDIDVDKEYQESLNQMANAIDASKIENVFFETLEMLNKLPYEQIKKNQTKFALGIHRNHKRYTKAEAELYGVVKENEVKTFYHMALTLPKQFVSDNGNSIESIMSVYRDKYAVFKRAIEEIPLDTLLLVRDLINQNSLLDGVAHIPIINEMIKYKKHSDTISNKEHWYTVTLLVSFYNLKCYPPIRSGTFNN